jgi:hypothetical protein
VAFGGPGAWRPDRHDLPSVNFMDLVQTSRGPFRLILGGVADRENACLIVSPRTVRPATGTGRSSPTGARCLVAETTLLVKSTRSSGHCVQIQARAKRAKSSDLIGDRALPGPAQTDPHRLLAVCAMAQSGENAVLEDFEQRSCWKSATYHDCRCAWCATSSTTFVAPSAEAQAVVARSRLSAPATGLGRSSPLMFVICGGTHIDITGSDASDASAAADRFNASSAALISARPSSRVAPLTVRLAAS